MATIYITNNAESGAGSFTQAITTAQPGDVIMPDRSVEPLAVPWTRSMYTVKSITLKGGRYPLSIDFSNSLAAGSIQFSGICNIEDVVFRDWDSSTKGYAPVRISYLATAGDNVITFNRCLFAGNAGSDVSAVAVSSNYPAVRFINCSFLGNYTRRTTTTLIPAVVKFYSAENAELASFVNCSFIGNVASTKTVSPPGSFSGAVFTDCYTSSSANDVVVGPPSDWYTSTWNKNAWKSWNPCIKSSSSYARGFNRAGEPYDFWGVPRVNGTCGAYEVVDADLYWIGTDGDYLPVDVPSMASSAGWATDRWADTGSWDWEGSTPDEVSTLFVNAHVEFTGTWTPTDGKIITGRGDVSATFGSEVEAAVGLGTLTFSGDVIAKSPLDGFIPVAPATLTASVASAESFAVSTGVTLNVGEGQIGALTMDGGSLVVTDSLNVDSLTLTSGTLNLAETNVQFDALAINGGNLVAGSLTLDSLSMSSGTVSLSGDAILKVTTDAALSGGSIVASGAPAYFVAPVGTSTSSITLDNVRFCNFGANVTSLTAIKRKTNASLAVGVDASNTDENATILFEKLTAENTWTVAAATQDRSILTVLPDYRPDALAYFRVFDGNQFANAYIAFYVPLAHTWNVYDQTYAIEIAPKWIIVTGYQMQSAYYNAGETPIFFARITNSATGEPVDPETIESITYTCFKKSYSWGQSTLSSVEGHIAQTVPTTAVLDEVTPPATDPRWTTDSTGYNFVFEPNTRSAALFPEPGDYQIVFNIDFLEGNSAPIVYNISVK